MSHDVLFHRLFDPPLRGSESDSETAIKIDVEYGHTYHCAARMNWGDGECECGRHDWEDWRASVAFRSSSPSFDDWRDEGTFE